MIVGDSPLTTQQQQQQQAEQSSFVLLSFGHFFLALSHIILSSLYDHRKDLCSCIIILSNLSTSTSSSTIIIMSCFHYSTGGEYKIEFFFFSQSITCLLIWLLGLTNTKYYVYVSVVAALTPPQWTNGSFKAIVWIFRGIS